MTTKKNRLISVSIDDGHPLDLKAAEILDKKGIPTTFYIPIKNLTGRPTLNKKQIRYLSRNPLFTIGGHTYNHVDLTKLTLSEAEKEIRAGKEALEDITGKKVSTFAWPWGRYNKKLVKLLRNLGFQDCRSAVIFNFNKPNKKNFLWHPNLHFYPHTKIASFKNCLKRLDFYSLFMRIKYFEKEHLDLINKLKENKASVRLWFHSEDLERLNLWYLINAL